MDQHKRVVKVAMIVGVIGAVVLALRLVTNSYTYRQAIRRNALDKHFDPDSILYPNNWPVDLYVRLLNLPLAPESAEVLVGNADSVRYFVNPDSGPATTRSLWQVFYFSFGPQTNEVQIIYRNGQVFSVDGSDWLPLSKNRRPRLQALAWYRTGVLQELDR